MLKTIGNSKVCCVEPLIPLSEEKLSAKSMHLQKGEASRKDRFFNAKQRTIGIDKEFLDKQVNEKTESETLKKKQENFLDMLMISKNKQLLKKDVESQKLRREFCKNMRIEGQSLTHYKNAMSRRQDTDFDNSEQKSLIIFAGEDPQKRLREKLQMAQFRDNLDQIVFEKEMKQFETKCQEKLNSASSCVLNSFNPILDEIETRRRKLNEEMKLVNFELASLKCDSALKEKRDEELWSQKEVSLLSSDKYSLGVSQSSEASGLRGDAYRGESEAARAQHYVNLRQQIKKNREKRSEENLCLKKEFCDMESQRITFVRNLASNENKKREALKKIRIENEMAAAIASEKYTQQKESARRDCVISDDFFSSFGTQTR